MGWFSNVWNRVVNAFTTAKNKVVEVVSYVKERTISAYNRAVELKNQAVNYVEERAKKTYEWAREKYNWAREEAERRKRELERKIEEQRRRAEEYLRFLKEQERKKRELKTYEEVKKRVEKEKEEPGFLDKLKGALRDIFFGDLYVPDALAKHGLMPKWVNTLVNKLIDLFTINVAPEGEPPLRIMGIGGSTIIKSAPGVAEKGAEALVKSLIDEGAEKLLVRLSKNPKGFALKLLSLPEEQLTKLIESLSKTKTGRIAIPRIIDAMKKYGTEEALTKKGFKAVLTKIKPKTILWALSGIAGLLGSAYGISFGTEWFAKEGLWELYAIPLEDRIRDFKYKPTLEKKKRLLEDLKKLEEIVPKAQDLIRKVAWLWPFTKSAWLEYANSLSYQVEQFRKEIESVTLPEELKLPEMIKARVVNITDGDTIEVAIQGKNLITGETINLPEYKTTGRARVRLVGINTPEKSPKGEIVCSDVEIYKVDPKMYDEARSNLLPLNDKWVTLKIDPEHQFDAHGRILALVEYEGRNINLEQIRKGLACGYYYEPNKWVDENKYREETLRAKRLGLGMWKGLEEVEKEEEKIKIRITSEPSNAKLYIDGIYTHHKTPSDEKELADVMDLLKPGEHYILVEKAGMVATKKITIKKGDNGTIHLTLEPEPTPEELKPAPKPAPKPTPEEIEKKKEEEEVKEVISKEEEKIKWLEEKGQVKPEEIPESYTQEQEWALKELFEKIYDKIKGKEQMSEKEFFEVWDSFNLYTEDQKAVVDLVMRDVWPLIKGREIMSEDEYHSLKLKYGIE